MNDLEGGPGRASRGDLRARRLNTFQPIQVRPETNMDPARRDIILGESQDGVSPL
jgi:hypothetical protein